MSWHDELDISVVNPHPSHGGQKVGAYNYPVKIVHIPTQITVICGYARSQHKNRTIALEMIEYALSELKLIK